MVRATLIAAVAFAGSAFAPDPPAVTYPADGPIEVRWKNFTVCAYHGLAEGTSYECLHMAGRLSVPPNMMVLMVFRASTTEALDAAGRPLPKEVPLKVPEDLAKAVHTEDSPAADKPTSEDHRLATSFFHRGSSPLTVSAGVHRLPRLPVRVGLLRGEVDVLLATETSTKRVALSDVVEFAEVGRELELRLNQVTPDPPAGAPGAEPSSSRVRVEGTVRKRAPAGGDDKRPLREAPILVALELLDEQGRPFVHSWESHAGPMWAAGWFESRLAVSAPVFAGRPIHSVRLTLVTSATVRTIPFELRDLPARELIEPTPSPRKDPP